MRIWSNDLPSERDGKTDKHSHTLCVSGSKTMECETAEWIIIYHLKESSHPGTLPSHTIWVKSTAAALRQDPGPERSRSSLHHLHHLHTFRACISNEGPRAQPSVSVTASAWRRYSSILWYGKRGRSLVNAGMSMMETESDIFDEAGRKVSLDTSPYAELLDSSFLLSSTSCLLSPLTSSFSSGPKPTTFRRQERGERYASLEGLEKVMCHTSWIKRGAYVHAEFTSALSSMLLKPGDQLRARHQLQGCDLKTQTPMWVRATGW